MAADFIASVTQELEELQCDLFSQHARLVERLRTRHQQLITQRVRPDYLRSTSALSVKSATVREFVDVGPSRQCLQEEDLVSIMASIRGELAAEELVAEEQEQDLVNFGAQRTLRSCRSMKLVPRKEWDFDTELELRASFTRDDEDDVMEVEASRREIERECIDMFHAVRCVQLTGSASSARGSGRGNTVVEGVSSNLSEQLEPRGMTKYRMCVSKPPWSPHSPKRLPWDMLGMALVLYEMVTIPVLLLVLPARDSFSSTLDLWLNVYWTMDVVLIFLTCVHVDGELTDDFWVIAKHYGRTWLMVDLLMVLPEWVLFLLQGGSRSGLSVMRMLKISRVVRLLRVLKMENAIRKQLSRFNSLRVLNMLKLVQMMLGFVMLNHFIACFWYFIGRETGDGWLDRYNGNAGEADGYTLALHWAISQFHGTADVTPGNIPERVFAISTQVAGLLVLSIFVSATTNIILQERQSRRRLYERMENLRMYFLHHQVSSQYVLSAKSYLQSKSDDQDFMDDLLVLQGLPDSLRKDIMFEARAPTVERHCLFLWLKEQHGPAFRTLCHSGFCSLRSMAGAVVFETGDAWEKLVFVEDGHLRYIEGALDREVRPSLAEISQKKVGIRAPKNSWLCELALWVQGWQCKGDFVSVTNSFSLSLDSSTFAQDLNNFPTARLDVVMYVRGLLQEIVDSDPTALTDLWKSSGNDGRLSIARPSSLSLR